MDFSIIADNWLLYVRGTWTTVHLVGLSLVLGLALALPLALMRTSRFRWLSFPAWLYIYFFRGTPLLVQIFIIYYGLGQFEEVRQSVAWSLLQEAYVCALISFMLNTAAYTAEIIRGSLETTPHGEIEAAKAMGMSSWLMFRRILLPSALRRALPAYSNEVIFMLQGSSIASVITIIDITGAARTINSRFYTPYEAFLTAAAIYMLLTMILVWLFKKAEHRWHAHLRPLEPQAGEPAPVRLS